jgi:hypothetical protein
MATYVLPQVLVFQELQLLPAVVANPLHAFISGGHAQLIRFGESDEKDLGALGAYDPLVEECFIWPNRETGAIVDPTYTKVWFEDALLEYFSDAAGSGSLIDTVAGFNNKITSDSVNFADNTSSDGTVFPRDAALLRDVQPGDIADVRAVVGPDTFDLRTFVQDLEGDPIAATIGALAEDASNAATSVAAAVVTKTDGGDNCVDVTADASLYDGYTSGFVTETYRVLVTESSSGSDATTAVLRVFSGSGEDDQLAVTPAAFGAPTSIGTRGLTATFDLLGGAACSASADNDTIAPEDLIEGQEWEIDVTADFTNPQDATSLSSAGTFTGPFATTYIIEITRGAITGGAAPRPQFTVTTTTGVDVSGPTTIPDAPIPSTFPVGTHGVLLSYDISTAGFRKGDKYLIDVTPQEEGAITTLILGNSLDAGIPSGTEVSLTLYIKKPTLQIPENREGFAPLVNWDQDATEICIKDAIEGAFDSSWALSGVPQSLPVVEGEMFVEYRAWRQDLCNEVNAVFDSAQLNDAIPGALHPDNELKWGVFKALQNSNGTEVKYAAVCDPGSNTAWIDVLDLIVGRDDVYGLVPLTKDKTVLDLFQAHVADQSNEINNRWRVLWANLEGAPLKVVAYEGNSTDSSVLLATLADDPGTSGTQFTLLQVPADNSNFITNGVRPGDTVRFLFTTDGFGNELWTEFEVDSVTTENELLLKTGHTVAITVAQKVEIWRNLSATEEAAELALLSGAWGDRRVRSTWPDRISSGETEMEGYFLNASLAGLVSGVVPHQGLTRLEISGYDDVSRTVDKFNKNHLDTMALAGTWIVTQDVNTGQIFTRHAVTTGDNADILEREEMITRNVDAISFEVFRLFDPFIGISNVTPSMIALSESLLDQLLSVMENRGNIERLGTQVITGTIRRLEQSPLLKDRIIVEVDLVVPAPLNNVEVHLIVTV